MNNRIHKKIVAQCISHFAYQNTQSTTIYMAEGEQLRVVTVKGGKTTPNAGAAAAGDGKCYFLPEND